MWLVNVFSIELKLHKNYKQYQLQIHTNPYSNKQTLNIKIYNCKITITIRPDYVIKDMETLNIRYLSKKHLSFLN